VDGMLWTEFGDIFAAFFVRLRFEKPFCLRLERVCRVGAARCLGEGSGGGGSCWEIRGSGVERGKGQRKDTSSAIS